MSKITTTLNLNTHARNGKDYEVEIEVEYSFGAGCQATYTQPGEDDSAEITAITVLEPNGDRYGADWLVTLLADDEELLALCLQDAAERRIDAEEYRADAIREERMLECGK